MNWVVATAVSEEVIQEALDDVPPALRYYSDQLPVYDGLMYYPGLHIPMGDKSQTYSVEADNAELRHYLARLGRRSRCFSRSIAALRDAVRLFVYCWNARQLYKRQYPKYPAYPYEFLNPFF